MRPILPRARVRGAVARRACLVLATLAGTALHAQQTQSRGRIEGEVADSVHGRKLSGAIVMATRLSAGPSVFLSTVTDEKGRFSLDTLAPGRYAVAFTHAMLDSLDILLPPREITLAEGERVRTDFATPSGATLRAAACPGLSLAAGTGAVVGEVRDADTERPIGGARVAVGWIDVSFDRTTMRAATTPRLGAATTDSLGLYRLCGVPTWVPLLIQVQTDKFAGAEISVMVDDTVGVAKRALSLSAGEAHSISDTTVAAAGDSVAPLRPLSGTATLAGVVRTQDGRPVENAHVRVVDAGAGATTDSAGRFQMSGLPAGSQVAEARKLGFELGRAQVELRRGQPSTLDVRLHRVVSLDSVRIVAQRIRYREFEQNRRNGWGRYMDAEEIEKRNAFDASDLLRMTPGVQVEGSGPYATVTSRRGMTSLMGSACTLNVVIDGIQNMDINMVRPGEIGAMEIYAGPSGIPPQYASNSSCGAVIIWTKR